MILSRGMCCHFRFWPLSFLLYVAGILTIILGCLFLKKGMDVMKALSILIVFGGIGVMFASNAGGGNLRGIALACWQVPATPSLFS